MKNVVIYGDIHGCLEEFEELRKKIPSNSIEITVGDFLDKGPYSKETIEYLRKNRIFSILGNHEYKYLRKKIGRKVKMDEEQEKIYNSLSDNDFEYIFSLPYFIKANKLTILHAGISNHIYLSNPSMSELNRLLFFREVDKNERFLPLNHSCKESTFWADIYDGHEGFVVYGHSAFLEIKKDIFSAGIDTGCVYGNKLSAIIIENTLRPYEYRVIEVKSKRKYAEPISDLK